MGLKCSLLGHTYEPAGVEREREKQGSEVVTVARELERCTRCDAERVVSESTEVTAVVDADDADLEAGDGGTGAGGGYRTGGGGDGDATAGERAAAAVDDLAEGPDDLDLEDRDPAEEDAEILTDDEPEREPGQWPEEAETESGSPGSTGDRPTGSDEDRSPGDESPEAEAEEVSDPERDAERLDEESLSGITVPDADIVCPECDFGVEAQSGYREGDPCPECGAWLESERNP